MEEYLEETRATFQTIDQFLMSKDFAIRDDLLVSLEHLQVRINIHQINYTNFPKFCSCIMYRRLRLKL